MGNIVFSSKGNCQPKKLKFGWVP